jgi:hypothetical protein
VEYTNPGELFVHELGLVKGPNDVMRYVDFLRKEAGIGCKPPVDLGKIYARFGIPVPEYATLPNQQGLLLDPNSGLMIIHDEDPRVRQRFTEAHELMEFLFSALPSGRGWAARRLGGFKQGPKERLCNEGAAELLMPEASFVPRVRAVGVSYRAARQLALEFEVSTTAALVRMVRIGPGRHAVVLWRMKNKPTEIRNMTPANQLSLFGDSVIKGPPKRLRVEWSMAGSSVPFIPVDKSVPEDSSIYAAWRDGVFTSGEDNLDLANCRGIFRCENQPFGVDDERQVFSLLHLPGDAGCALSPINPG